MKTIKQFQEEYRFLSNFWYCPVAIDGIVYPTSEHAYQAQKSPYVSQRRSIARFVTSPGEAKRKGQHIKAREDWDKVKVGIMLEVVRAKFQQNADLAKKLLATGDAILEEGNYWHDTFWGVDLKTGKGENRLGKILMQVRKELRSI